MNSSLLFRRVIQQYSIRSFNNISSRFTSSSSSTTKSPSESSPIDSELKNKITDFIKANKVAIFIKGEPNAPSCGFSNAVLQILKLHGCEFKSKNILEDVKLRETMKIYSNWPTFPQVYFNGEFVGGCDILLQMHQSGELVEELKKVGIQSKLSNLKNTAPSSSSSN
ncbi:unnamed protein product [Rotaria magnacalcarata]|uniref:Glutaredoxin-related protein 5, mitochondrial n=1 Tax=Rotaria magnacalcarata TaxID=392030 RepID=A0A819IC16_9BILA|nr:unnamed protein product [Rotaria magnacalcarata]CAF2126272.1 unnamed protein product [Rotaria magnacalcarata]CAF3868223.1 unnamed protein product [Rotaria magnacalcarata]CAF3912397.1 unnamed protein product [Rotaria magnacalcarata]